MIREAVVGRDSDLLQLSGTLLSQSESQSFHISMVLIIRFEEQYGARAQRLCPLHIIPVFGMPFGLRKKFRGRSSVHRMQLRFPAFQAGFALFWISVNSAQIHRCDHCYRFDIRVMTRLISSDEPAEAVSDQDQLFRISPIFCSVRRLAQKVDLELLARIASADCEGRGGGFDCSAMDWFLDRARALGVQHAPPEPLVKGRHLIELGVVPGPAVGEVLREVYERQLDGTVTDFDAAFVLARQIARDRRLY